MFHDTVCRQFQLKSDELLASKLQDQECMICKIFLLFLTHSTFANIFNLFQKLNHLTNVTTGFERYQGNRRFAQHKQENIAASRPVAQMCQSAEYEQLKERHRLLEQMYNYFTTIFLFSFNDNS